MALRLGILSTARINEMILRGVELVDDVDVVAVASRDAERAEAYARSHGIPHAFGSYDELLAIPDIDAVYISLPNSMHVNWSVRALQAGKHVLCEKPLTDDPAEAERAFDVAARAGKVLTEAFMYRCNPQIAKLRSIVGEGLIGRVQFIRSSLRYETRDHADVRLAPSLAGGSLMDLGCYCVNVTRLIAGEPERVYGEQLLGATGVDVAFQGTMRFPGGAVAQFDSSFVALLSQTLEVVGDEGSARLSAPFRIDLGTPTLELIRQDGEQSIEPIEVTDSYALELEQFAAAAGGAHDPAPGEESIAQARVIAALYESARRRVPVDVERRRT